MKTIESYDLVNQKEFIREPVDTICRELDKIEENIILNGEGRGRSVILDHMQNKKAGTETPFINACLGLRTPPAGYNYRFVEHYLEIEFSFELLYYLEQYYEKVFNTYAIKTYEFLDVLERESTNFLSKQYYKPNLELSTLLSTGEISGEILECMKKNCNLSNIQLGIDDFDIIDMINGQSFQNNTQKILYKYFSLFDKVILSVNDEKLNHREYHDYYKVKEINYGDVQTIRLMFTKRIEIYNAGQKVNDNKLSIDWLRDDLILTLIEKTNGNLKLILDILWEVADSIKFYERYNDSIFNNILEEKLGTARRLKQHQRPPKFYI